MCRKVYAVDVDFDRLAFLESRLNEQEIHNVYLVQARNFRTLPFDRACFQFIATGDFTFGFEGEAFRDRVAVSHELLRSGGLLCFQVGNRVGFHRVFRSRAQDGRKGNRSWHTPLGYRRILQKAGFRDIQAYAPLPYHSGIAMFYIPVGCRAALSFFLRNLFPLFEAVSPEVKKTYSKEYRLAKVATRLALACRLENVMTFFLSGFVLFSRKSSETGSAA